MGFEVTQHEAGRHEDGRVKIKGSVYANGPYELFKEGEEPEAEVLSLQRNSGGGVDYEIAFSAKAKPEPEVTAPETGNATGPVA